MGMVDSADCNNFDCRVAYCLSQHFFLLQENVKVQQKAD